VAGVEAATFADSWATAWDRVIALEERIERELDDQRRDVLAAEWERAYRAVMALEGRE
jgi:hypothetical protein